MRNNYGKEGHFGKDCPILARVVTRTPVHASVQHQQKRRGNRPQATGRVYAVMGVKGVGFGNLVMSC